MASVKYRPMDDGANNEQIEIKLPTGAVPRPAKKFNRKSLFFSLIGIIIFMYFIKFLLISLSESGSFRPRKLVFYRINETWNICFENFNDSRLYIQDKPQSDYEGLSVIYFVTASISRPEQIPQLLRLGHTLMHVPKIHWIVADSRHDCNPVLNELLQKFKIPFTLLATPVPLLFETTFHNPKRVSSHRNALRYLRHRQIDQGVLYFGDEDYAFDLKLFDEIRLTKIVSMFPTALVDNFPVNTPILHKNKVVASLNSWRISRKWMVDMSGFALNLQYVSKYPNATIPFSSALEEDYFLKMLHINRNIIEPMAKNCTEILVWHVETIPNKAVHLVLMPAVKDKKGNLRSLYENLQKLGIGNMQIKKSNLQTLALAKERYQSLEPFDIEADDVMQNDDEYLYRKDLPDLNTFNDDFSPQSYESTTTEKLDDNNNSNKGFEFSLGEQDIKVSLKPQHTTLKIDTSQDTQTQDPNPSSVERPSEDEMNMIDDPSNDMKISPEELGGKVIADALLRDKQEIIQKPSIAALLKSHQISQAKASQNLKKQKAIEKEKFDIQDESKDFSGENKGLQGVIQRSILGADHENFNDFPFSKPPGVLLENSSEISKRRVTRNVGKFFFNLTNFRQHQPFVNTSDELNKPSISEDGNDSKIDDNLASNLDVIESIFEEASTDSSVPYETSTNNFQVDRNKARFPNDVNEEGDLNAILSAAVFKIAGYTERVTTAAAKESHKTKVSPWDFIYTSSNGSVFPMEPDATHRIINQAVRKISQKYFAKLNEDSRKATFASDFPDYIAESSVMLNEAEHETKRLIKNNLPKERKIF